MAATGRRWTARFSAISPRGLNAHGIGVAIPSYDLCPDVSVDDIIRQMRMASRELARLGQPLVISGHSAGGHLAACMLATDWPAFDASLPRDLVTAAYAISACSTWRRWSRPPSTRALHLDAAAARAASPLFWNAPARGSLDAVVGGKESAEYFRQSRTIVDAWGAAGVADTVRHGAGANHFTAIAPLADPGLADGAAAEATGGALGFKKVLDGPDLGSCAKLL